MSTLCILAALIWTAPKINTVIPVSRKASRFTVPRDQDLNQAVKLISVALMLCCPQQRLQVTSADSHQQRAPASDWCR